MPLSLSLATGSVLVHANAGGMYAGDTGRRHFTWGLGTEVQLAERTWFIGETFGQDRNKPFFQIGLRHWLVPDRIQLDATYGERLGGFANERWWTIGLRLLSVPFLP